MGPWPGAIVAIAVDPRCLPIELREKQIANTERQGLGLTLVEVK